LCHAFFVQKKEAEELRQELADTNHKLSLALKVEDESGVSPGILDESVVCAGFDKPVAIFESY